MRAQLVQRLAQQIERRGFVKRATPFPLHRADDGRRSKARAEIDDLSNERFRLPPFVGVGVGQAEPVDDHAGAGANGGDVQI